VESRAWPLFEVEEGLRYTVTREPAGIPVAEYLRAQQRYAHLTDAEVGEIQAEVDRRWQQLIRRTGEQP
ncbi:MAG: pyruvate synthase subunit beta, partial [candidate division NC10 bacterium]